PGAARVGRVPGEATGEKENGPMPIRRGSQQWTAASPLGWAPGRGPARLARGPPPAGQAPAGDPRFVGPGMKSDLLPHWPMFRHDALHSAVNPIAPPASPAIKWAFETGGQVWSSPAVGLDGTVHVGSLDKKRYAVPPGGRLLWAFETFAYVFSSPAVAGDGTVYFTSVDGHLYAVRNGQLKWAVPLLNCAFSSPVLGRDGMVYVGSNSW